MESKICPNLFHKKKYIIHIAALNQSGLVLKLTHWVIQFDQSVWLALYIAFNTQLRAMVKNNFEKDFLKLMNSTVFRKTMESIRKHRDIKLMTSEKAYLKKVMKQNFEGKLWFNDNLIGCEMGKIQVLMNKAAYLGQAILDLSKIIM